MFDSTNYVTNKPRTFPAPPKLCVKVVILLIIVAKKSVNLVITLSSNN